MDCLNGPSRETRFSGESVSRRERFLILTREISAESRRLQEILSPIGIAEIIADSPAGGGIWYPDEKAKGYRGMMGFSAQFPQITAWSRAMCHLSETLEPGERVWFVEDDVAGSNSFFTRLVKLTADSDADLSAFEIRSRDEDPGWPCWSLAEPWFNRSWRSFSPLCCVSSRLLDKAMEFGRNHGRLAFHEILFASLAANHGMKLLDWSLNPNSRALFGEFRYRPALEGPVPGVCHPVKSPQVHEGICMSAVDPGQGPHVNDGREEFPRMGYMDHSAGPEMAEDYVFLVRHCRRNSIRNVMESGRGNSTLAFLDAGCLTATIEHDENRVKKSIRTSCGDSCFRIEYPPPGDDPDPWGIQFVPDLIFVSDSSQLRQHVSGWIPVCGAALELCGHFILLGTREACDQDALQELRRRGMHVLEIPTRKGLAMVVDPGRRPELLPQECEKPAAKYIGSTRNRWIDDDLYGWSIWFSNQGPVKALEIGVSDGVSANLILDLLFTHHGSEIHCIEDFGSLAGGDELWQNFERNAAGRSEQVYLYDGTSHEILAWMIAGEDFWMGFDFIHLANSHAARDLLSNACQAWHLLKPGGIMVFGGLQADDEKRAAVTAFLSAQSGQFREIFDGKRVAVSKAL